MVDSGEAVIEVDKDLKAPLVSSVDRNDGYGTPYQAKVYYTNVTGYKALSYHNVVCRSLLLCKVRPITSINSAAF